MSRQFVLMKDACRQLRIVRLGIWKEWFIWTVGNLLVRIRWQIATPDMCTMAVILVMARNPILDSGCLVFDTWLSLPIVPAGLSGYVVFNLSVRVQRFVGECADPYTYRLGLMARLRRGKIVAWALTIVVLTVLEGLKLRLNGPGYGACLLATRVGVG